MPISFDFEGGDFKQTQNTHWLSPFDDHITIELPTDRYIQFFYYFSFLPELYISFCEIQFFKCIILQSLYYFFCYSQSKALIVNVQQTGYYRVNYDLKNWNMITKCKCIFHF